MSEDVIEVSEESFEREVLSSPQPVLVDFWAPWCGPCRTIAPSISRIAQDYAGRAKVVRVNTDQSQALAERFRIRAIPTILVFREGRVVSSALGVRSQQEYEALLQQAMEGEDTAL